MQATTWKQHLAAMRRYPHLVRDRLQVNTTINDTGNTQRHAIVNLPYISDLARNEAASLVGLRPLQGHLVDRWPGQRCHRANGHLVGLDRSSVQGS